MTVTVRVERHVLRRDPRRGVGARVRGPKWQVRRVTRTCRCLSEGQRGPGVHAQWPQSKNDLFRSRFLLVGLPRAD